MSQMSADGGIGGGSPMNFSFVLKDKPKKDLK